MRKHPASMGARWPLGGANTGYVSLLTVSLTVVLGLSFGSTALGQEARWRALYNQTMELYQQGKYREAIPVAKELLKVAERTFGPDHQGVVLSLNYLAEVYLAQGKYVQAEPLFKRSPAIREKDLGADHPRVATGLNNLAALYEKMVMYDEAKKLLERADSIQESQ